MDDLKDLYEKIENPIDNRVKWNKILAMYSSSSDFDDFYLKVDASKKTNTIYYDEEEKEKFALVIWSLFKSCLLSFNDDELLSLISTHEFNMEIYDIVRTTQTLDSVRNYRDLTNILRENDNIKGAFSKMYSEQNGNIVICSKFGMRKDTQNNTVLIVTVDAKKVYDVLKTFVNLCIDSELPYFIKFNETGKKIVLNIHVRKEDIKKCKGIIDIIKKENYTFFYENKKSLLEGNLDHFISIKNMNNYNRNDYASIRCLILFKSFDSVLYDYILNHKSIIVSYKDGRMNLNEYISSFVMEKIVNSLLKDNIKTRDDFFLIVNSNDLTTLKDYIKSRLSFNMQDILSLNLYNKDDSYNVKLTLNNEDIDVSSTYFMEAIRNLTQTLILKDNSLEKMFRARIKNECAFYSIDPNKFCTDASFARDINYSKELYEKYNDELDKIREEIKMMNKVDNLVKKDATNEERDKIKSDMGELLNFFED